MEIGDKVFIEHDPEAITAESIRLSSLSQLYWEEECTITDISDSPLYNIKHSNGITWWYPEALIINYKDMATVKKIKANKTELPSLEEAKNMSPDDLYNKYYETVKSIIIKEYYACLNDTQVSKFNKEQKQLDKLLIALFYGASAPSVSTVAQVKQVIINYLENKEKLDTLANYIKRFTKIKEQLQPLLNQVSFTTFSKKLEIYIGRMMSLLFPTTDFKETIEVICKEFKSLQDNKDAIEKMLIEKNPDFDKVLEFANMILSKYNYIISLQEKLIVIYTNDFKKLALKDNQQLIQDRLQQIKITKKDQEVYDEVIDLIENWNKEDYPIIARHCKYLFKTYAKNNETTTIKRETANTTS